MDSVLVKLARSVLQERRAIQKAKTCLRLKPQIAASGANPKPLKPLSPLKPQPLTPTFYKLVPWSLECQEVV